MNRAEFGAVYEQYQPRIRAWLRYRVQDEDLADDLTSDTFMNALRYIDTFRPVEGATVSSWLYRIAGNRLIDHIRRMRPTEGLEPFEATLPAPDRLANDIERIMLEEALARCRPQYRRLLRMHYIEDLGVAEIAARTRLSRGVLYRELSFARLWLRAALESGPEKPPPAAPERLPDRRPPADDCEWPEWFDRRLLDRLRPAA